MWENVYKVLRIQTDGEEIGLSVNDMACELFAFQMKTNTVWSEADSCHSNPLGFCLPWTKAVLHLPELQIIALHKHKEIYLFYSSRTSASPLSTSSNIFQRTINIV